MDILIRLLGPDDAPALQHAKTGVFDDPVIPERAAEFLGDARHHIAVATVAGSIAGFASAVHYVHPDKGSELWINEVGVAPAFHRQGIATRLLDALFDLAASLGCTEAWVLTDAENEAAMRLYRSAGGEATPQVMFTFRVAQSDGRR